MPSFLLINMKHANEIREQINKKALLKNIEETIDSNLNNSYNVIEYFFSGKKTAEKMMGYAKELCSNYENYGWELVSFVPIVLNEGESEYDRDSDRVYDKSIYGFKVTLKF